MPPLIEYPVWIGQVNAELTRLSAGLFSAEDFDYPWVEKFQAELPADQAAREALENDGFIVEKLTQAVVMLYPRKAVPSCPA